MGELRNSTNFLFYARENGTQNMRVFLDEVGETIRMTQKEMSAVFGIGIHGISKHLSKIFEGRDFAETSVCAFFAHTAKIANFYRLIISETVGKPLFKSTQPHSKLLWEN